MEHLTQRDLRALRGFLRRTYALRDVENFTRQTLADLQRLVPCDLAAYCEMDPPRRISRNWLQPANFYPAAHDKVWPTVMHEHSVLSYNAETRDGRARKISDFVSAAQFHRGALYNEFYRPIRLEDVLCFAIPSPGPFVFGFGFHRDTRSFTERERRLLNLVRPHLAQARRNAEKLTKIKQRLELAEKILETLPLGLAVLSPQGRIRYLTPEAQRFLDEYWSKKGSGASQLPEDLAQWVQHQESQLSGTDIPAPRRPLILETAGKRLVVRLISGATESVLVFEGQPLPSLSNVLEGSTLSEREKEVCGWVTQGKTNSEIATILSISRRTVEKHVEHIFQKLGVETRTAAAARIMEHFVH